MARLIYITQEYWPTHRADIAVLFGKYLRGFGVEAHLVASRDPDQPARDWQGGGCTLCTMPVGAMRRRLRAVWHALKCASRADPKQFDAVQVRDMPFVASIVLLIARAKGLRFLYWMSFPIPEGQIMLARARGLSAGWMKFVYPFVSGHVGRFLLRHWVQRHADHLFVQSPRMQRDLQQQGVPAHRSTPVLMGVDFAAMRALPPLSSPDPRLRGRRVIGYLGTLDPARKVEGLFDMLARVRKHVPAAVLLIVGDTEDEHHRRWLNDQCAASGVADAVIWAGWLPTQEGWHLIRQAEVALSMFPRGELLDSASPTKVPEYLALGLPVVCNDNPDQQAIVEASGAGRCVPYTPRAFSEAVLELMALPPDEREQMAEAGRRYVQTHRDYPHLARILAEDYHRILEAS